jgi:hypothetical protein
LLIGGTVAAFACTATNGNQFPGTGGAGGGSQGTSTGGDIGFTTGTGSGTSSGDDGILTSTPPCSASDANADLDGDGFSIAQGDCNDCTAKMNPGAFDYPGNNVDEDCNGKADDNPTACDGNLAVGSNNAEDGAKAIGLCKKANGASWGLVNARWATADNQPLSNFPDGDLGHGILNAFGPNVHPQEGHKMLALSSGTARQPTDPGYQSVTGFDKGYSNSPPPGFPKESPSCPGSITGQPHDSAALEITVKVPSNAKSLAFNLDFYTYEYPEFICSEFNDFFVALLNPPPTSLPDGNISFDSQGNLISVNAGFLQVCHPTQAGGKSFDCPLGAGQLKGTGFDLDFLDEPTDNSAATGWLQTSAPVEGGSTIKLRFAVWDSGDGVLDSTVLVDNLTWDPKGGETVTTPIGVPK